MGGKKEDKVPNGMPVIYQVQDMTIKRVDPLNIRGEKGSDGSDKGLAPAQGGSQNKGV